MTQMVGQQVCMDVLRLGCSCTSNNSSQLCSKTASWASFMAAFETADYHVQASALKHGSGRCQCTAGSGKSVAQHHQPTICSHVLHSSDHYQRTKAGRSAKQLPVRQRVDSCRKHPEESV